MIKFLIDENAGFTLVKYLREHGFDVKSVSELFPSRDDTFVMDKAYHEGRIIITNDKDFGYLFYKNKLPAIGIILLRLEDESIELKIDAIKTILSLPEKKIQNHFIVASENKIRIRPLER
jgi:predicted nuclease of predicted toxin-antitoxin system